MLNLERILSRVTYKPLTRFSVWMEGKRVHINIVFWVFNAEQSLRANRVDSGLGQLTLRTEKPKEQEEAPPWSPFEPVPFDPRSFTPPKLQEFEVMEVVRSFSLSYSDLDRMTEETFLKRLFNEVSELERHEQEEFFRVDGKPLVAPHPEIGEAKYA